MSDIDRVRSALDACDPGVGREEWLRVVMAARAAGLDRDTVDAWSSQADSYSARDFASVWASLKGNGITEATLFRAALDAGWRDPARDDRPLNGHSGHAKPQERARPPRKAADKVQSRPFDAEAIWTASEPAPLDHPYIARKLGLPIGLRVYRGAEKIAGNRIDGALLVPAFDASGKLHTFQAILPSGTKLNAPGKPMSGWFTIPGNGTTTFICEGIGAAWSAHQATSSTAICAFGVGNLEKVAVQIKKMRPDARLVLVADVGVEAKVDGCAQSIGAASIAPPVELGDRADINDLHQRDGLQAVADLLAQAREPERDEPIEIDIADLARREPDPPVFIVPELLPAGEVTLFAANGGTGKSQVELELAVALALQLDFFGIPVQQRAVDLVSFEDNQKVLHWRLRRICEARGIKMADLAGKLRLFDGSVCLSSWFARGQFGVTAPTEAFYDMSKRIGGGDRVVMVDGSSDAFAGNENDRAEVKAFIRTLRRLIGPAGALLLLAHVDKPAAKLGAESLGFSGSTGWNNGVRCRWHMYPEGDDVGSETGNVILEVKKSNLGRTGARMVLRFDPEASVFQRVDSELIGRKNVFKESDEADAIVQAVRAAWAAGDPVPTAASGQRTAHSVCEARGGLPGSLSGRSGRRRFYRALEQLRAAGALRVESFRRPNRHVSEVFNVPN